MHNMATMMCAVALSATLFWAATAASEDNPFALAMAAMDEIGPLARSCAADMSGDGQRDHVKVRVRMHDGDPLLNGCGFYFRVDGRAGGSDREYFPQRWDHRCTDGDTYKMRVTRPAATYEQRLRLDDGGPARQAELHADGWHDTFVDSVCVAFGELAAGRGPRAFCVNSGLLKACRALLAGGHHSWATVDDGWRDILMTRTTRGAHKIIFRDVDALADGFDELERDRSGAVGGSGDGGSGDGDRSDPEVALRAVCARIDLVNGSDREEDRNCPAEKMVFRRLNRDGRLGSSFSVQYSNLFTSKYINQEKNPYGCVLLSSEPQQWRAQDFSI